MTADEQRLERLKTIVSRLPDSPGCYQYLDASGVVIYVGKAKNLKRRVSSYFRTEVDRYKTKVLVSKIQDIKYAVVKTDQEAFLLENSLIKKYNPRYNVLLKDGKTYPYICVTKEEYPRIFKTRRVNKKFAYYYGPFSHIGSMYAMLEIIHKLYKPRTCNLPMTHEGVSEGKYKSCLEWHIKNCKAPCIAKQSHEDYLQNIAEAKEILKGNTRQISREIYNRMMQFSAELRFEEAEEMKRRYLLIEDYCSKSEVVSNTINDVDVFSITNDEKIAYINFLHVANGSINQAFTFEYKKKLDESDADLLPLGIVEMRDRFDSKSKEIILPFEVDLPEGYASVTIPQIGGKKKLLELSKLNVKQHRIDRLNQAEKLNPEQRQTRLMKEIQTQLGLPKIPLRIELFDNSNIQGEDAVAGCVVFDKLKPNKKEYRTYNIKTVVGPDDYASMREVVERRYSRLAAEGGQLPDLIIADGGVGQMEAIRHIVVERLGLDIPIAGLAKDSKHRTREMLFGNPPVSVGVQPDSQLFRLLTQMQDEVHRFAISFHRNKRSKRQRASELDSVVGLGEKTKSLILKHFGSVKRTKEATLEDLQALLGPVRGQKIYEQLHTENPS